jgi:hypothetical protein
MSFATTIKTLKKQYVINEKKTKKGTDEVIEKDVEVTYSKDAIEYINKFIENLIVKYDLETIKKDEELYNYMMNTLQIYEKNMSSSELKNTNQKSGLTINMSNVNKHVIIPDGKKKIKKDELVVISSFVEKLLNIILDETSKITVNEFNKHTVSPNHIKLAIFNNPLLLKYYSL